MYLKEIRVKNFKSFGSSRRIPFTQGFTTITGPNGSGKSNIGDCILFVLGPRSPKAIRAGRLTDLIFNGGKSGRPATSCSVTLVFDNSDRILPIDNDTVELRRKVKISPRNPENYYSYFYVNDRSASLGDFVRILAHARISADGYNIVQQGDINSIINATDLERRRVLDSVVGITDFDKKVDNARKRLGETDLNIGRTDIFLGEIRKKMRQLKREKTKAERYRKLRDERQTVQAKMARKRVLMLEQQIAELTDHIKRYLKESDTFSGEIKKVKSAKSKARSERDELDEKIIELGGEEAEQMKKEIEALNIEIARAEEAISLANEDSTAKKNRIRERKSEIKHLDREIKEKKKEEDQIRRTIEKREKELAARNEKLNEVKDRISRHDDSSLSLQKKLNAIKKEFNSCRTEHHELQLELDRELEKHDRLAEALTGMENEIGGYEFEVKDLDYALKDVQKTEKTGQEKRISLKAQLLGKREEEEKMLRQLNELEDVIRGLERKEAQFKAEIEAAESAQKGYNSAVNAVLDSRNRGDLPGVHGTIAELADVDQKYSTALSIAAGLGGMQAIVVEDDETAARAIKMLKSRKLGRARFLPLNRMNPVRLMGKAKMVARDPDAIGFAIDLIEFDGKYEAAFSDVFKSTVVVKSLNAARRLVGGVRMVTLDGDLVEGGGAMVGGSIRRSGLAFGKSDMGQLEEISRKLHLSIDNQISLHEQLKHVRMEIIQIDRTLREAGDGDSGRVNDMEVKRNQYAAKLKNLRHQHKEKETQLKELKKVISEKESIAEAKKDHLHELEDRHRELNDLLLKTTDKELARELKELQEDTGKRSEELRELRSSLEVLQTQLELIRKRHQEILDGITEMENRIGENRKKIVVSKARITEITGKHRGLLDIEAEMSAELEGIRKDRNEYDKKVLECNHQLENLNSKLFSYNSLVADARARIDSSGDELKEATAEFGTFDIELDDDLPPLEELKPRLRALDREIESLEPINMRAIEEFESAEQSEKELAADVKRMKAQRKSLLKLIEETEENKKKKLSEVVLEVNRNFKEIYSELVEGGVGSIELDDPDDPFTGGLVIRAKPKDKRVTRLQALSGGEKSMAAVAFIFAIQRYDPSPFYVLDEVDMFLDGINASAVAAMLRRNSASTQFIVVSLRQITIREADVRFGVTMLGDGISQVFCDIAEDRLQELAKDEFVSLEDEKRLAERKETPGKVETKEIDKGRAGRATAEGPSG